MFSFGLLPASITLATIVISPGAIAGDSPANKPSEGSLSRQAKIKMEEAEDIALKSVPGNTRSIELEFDDGRLTYEIEICQGKVKKEVTIDAMTGAVIEIDKKLGKCD